MILVIADDFSGAAELAGIAASRGLRAEVHTKLDTGSTAHVVAIDAQTRQLPPEAAAQRVREIHQQAGALTPSHIFKKTDSVLRGNVLAELTALLDATGKRRVLFIPANPSNGRVIRQGHYLIKGVPLNQSVFANDPDHPQRSADVLTVLSAPDATAVQSVRATDPLPAEGIVIPDAESPENLKRRAADLDSQTLAAGAAEFFTAVLERWIAELGWQPDSSLCSSENKPFINPRKTGSLFISGSLAAWDRGTGDEAREHGVQVFEHAQRAQSAEEVANALPASRCVMMTIGPRREDRSPSELTQALAASACEVIHRTRPETVFIEGGATASAVLAGMEWTRFKAVASDLVGVGSLVPYIAQSAPWKPTLFIKPGSYPWPTEIWDMAGNTSSGH